ncbi:hypothetical protein [Herbaspirillum huttiense]|uniref:hypothetical protein n=1 Tax=Herbaspirillum huttiense TaxID=863372 RepID=UPI0031E350F0
MSVDDFRLPISQTCASANNAGESQDQAARKALFMHRDKLVRIDLKYLEARCWTWELFIDGVNHGTPQKKTFTLAEEAISDAKIFSRQLLDMLILTNQQQGG